VYLLRELLLWWDDDIFVSRNITLIIYIKLKNAALIREKAHIFRR